MHAAPAAAIGRDSASSAAAEALARTHAPPAETFDYVVVGGGAAGCVLANRLSEDPRVSVLLLEAGAPDESFYARVPLGFPYLLGSSTDWAYVTEPEPKLNDRRLYFPRGKVLGGSHAISVMLYNRGDSKDYDANWPDTWSASDVLPYFIKSESQSKKRRQDQQQQHAAPSTGDSPKQMHGFQGPLAVSDLATPNPMTTAFVSAGEACGLPQNTDFNDWSRPQNGVGYFQVTQRDGVRETPATAYLDPVIRRSNLVVRSGVCVERILVDEADGQAALPTATGVSYIDGSSKRRTVAAAREVLLTAGIYASPQLLMLSGIGPGSHLKSHGIPVVVDSPNVGQNLQDHAAVMLSYESREPLVDKRASSVYYTERTGKSVKSIMNYLFRGKGPLTSPMCEAGGFVKTDPAYASCDLQLRFIPFFSEPDPYLSLADFALGGDYIRNKSNRPAGFTLQSVVARPRSRGSVQLRSADVRDRVAITANWMSHPEDMATLVRGLQLSRKIVAQEPLAEYRGREVYPGGDSVSDADLEAYVRHSCHTANAMVGTCRMGADQDSVVDEQLRVRGVANLRIVDSSIMPTLPGGQAGAPTMMIAERAADLIKQSAAAGTP
jgi:choline dehydrogenase